MDEFIGNNRKAGLCPRDEKKKVIYYQLSDIFFMLWKYS